MSTFKGITSTSTPGPTVLRRWTAAASRNPDWAVLLSTDPREIIIAVSHEAAGIVTNESAADFALKGIEFGIKTRSRIDPKSLGLTHSEATIIKLRAASMSWIDVGEYVGYCSRQVRRISSRLTARFGCTAEALTGLAQVIDLPPYGAQKIEVPLTTCLLSGAN